MLILSLVRPRRRVLTVALAAVVVLIATLPVRAQSVTGSSSSQACPDYNERRSVVMSGNAITTKVFNFGLLPGWGNNDSNLFWNGLGYGYTFAPFVAGKVQITDPVTGTLSDTVIVSDGLTDGGDISDTGDMFWSWQPIPCVSAIGDFSGRRIVASDTNAVPVNDAPDANGDGRPDSWPSDWYNTSLGEYSWPGEHQFQSSNADKEVLYYMNDYQNREFLYYPFPSDSTKRGLGLEVETRLYQWSHPQAEDFLMMVHSVTNKSKKDLEEIILGFWGDPNVGGATDFSDDLVQFEANSSLVYSWDDDGESETPGVPPGYFGMQFLESPGMGSGCIGGHASTADACTSQGGTFVAGDEIDNDGDGTVDESWTDGLDNDGDWNPETDDVGVDGVADTGDEGEGDGEATAGSQYDILRPGEPNFEFTDLDESDEIGLTSFAAPLWGTEEIRHDDNVWDLVEPGSFERAPEHPGDYVLVLGTGSFALPAGATKRFSVALVLGEDYEDLAVNAEFAQEIYRAGYRIPPPSSSPAEDNGSALARTPQLSSSYPNPFSGVTQFSYSLPSPDVVSVKVYDVLGRVVKTLVNERRVAAGTHKLSWDGTNASGMKGADGIYFYALEHSSGRITQEMALLK